MRSTPPPAVEREQAVCTRRRDLIAAIIGCPLAGSPLRAAAATTRPAALRLFDRHLALVGGESAWRRVRSLTALGTLHDREGNLQAHQLATRIAPSQWRVVRRQAAQLTTLAAAGERAGRWVLTAVAAQAFALEAHERAGWDEEAAPAAQSLLRPMYPEQREPVTARDGNRPVHRVVVRSRAGRAVELAFDVEGGGLHSRRWLAEDGERLERYLDYRAIRGEPVKVPTRIESWIDGRLHQTLRQSTVVANIAAADEIEASLEAALDEIKRFDRAPAELKAAVYESIAAIDWRRFVEQPGTSWSRETSAIFDRMLPPTTPAPQGPLPRESSPTGPASITPER